MRKLVYIFIFFLVFSCSSNEKVFWCGDHPCIDKNEKDEYFKKNMIVEVRYKSDDENISEFKKILDSADMENNEESANKKVITLNKKKEEKLRLKNEKRLAKIERKRKIKKEKELKKLAKIKEKKRLMKERELEKKIKRVEKKAVKKNKSKNKIIAENTIVIEKIEKESSNFNLIVEQIIKRNSFKPFPDINDIPN